MSNTFLFIGGDCRMKYAAEYINTSYAVSTLGLGETIHPTGKFDNLVLPLPFSRDGICINAPLSPEPIPLDIITEYAAKDARIFAGGNSVRLSDLCNDNGLTAIDYFADEPLTLKNAALTAEAAVAMLITATEYSLCNAKVLITGYGRIAAYTARLLHCFGADVTIAARRAEQRAKAETDLCKAIDMSELYPAAEKNDIIINTVPTALFERYIFHRMQPDAIYMELATRKSAPEVDYSASSGVRYIAAGGLPGKFTPKTAGIAIAQTVLSHINIKNNMEGK